MGGRLEAFICAHRCVAPAMPGLDIAWKIEHVYLQLSLLSKCFFVIARKSVISLYHSDITESFGRYHIIHANPLSVRLPIYRYF